MAGIFGWARRGEHGAVRGRVSLEVLQLQTAKEILGEVFGAAPADVEEMIRQRCEEQRAWPEELWSTE